jgi:transposase
MNVERQDLFNPDGMSWHDAPTEYRPHKTLYFRRRRWREKGIFARMLPKLADNGGNTDTLMIDAQKTHGTASGLSLQKGSAGV